MSDSTQPGPTQFKLLVNTASEAVQVIRERYGERARVLSVKQIDPGGLKRLVSKPRLEVIVEVSPAAAKAPQPQPKDAPAAEPAASTLRESAPGGVEPIREERMEKEDTAEEPQTAPLNRSPIGDLYSKQSAGASSPSSYFSQFEGAASDQETPQESAPAAAPLGTAANPVRRGTLEAVQRAVSMLESVGLDRSLIERIRSEIDFKDIGSLPTMDLYAKICDWLRSRFPATGKVRLAPRRAFFGCSGVGKTSALCKMLSADVFVNRLSPNVLKVDTELPNASDGLEVFCEIMGVSLARSLEEIGEVSEGSPLLVDLPGYTLANRDSIESCREALDELGIEERILVVNAAYEAELIAEMLAAGESIGANKVVFTHLEESRKAGKLWKFLLNRRMQPLFFSEGPNPAGEYTMEPYSYLLERTFPNGRELAAAGRKGRGAPAPSRREASVAS